MHLLTIYISSASPGCLTALGDEGDSEGSEQWSGHGGLWLLQLPIHNLSRHGSTKRCPHESFELQKSCLASHDNQSLFFSNSRVTSAFAGPLAQGAQRDQMVFIVASSLKFLFHSLVQVFPWEWEVNLTKPKISEKRSTKSENMSLVMMMRGTNLSSTSCFLDLCTPTIGN